MIRKGMSGLGISTPKTFTATAATTGTSVPPRRTVLGRSGDRGMAQKMIAHRSNSRRSKGGWKLQITLNKKKNEILILGDRAGLEYLAGCCLGVIGKTGANGHIMLDSLMYNLSSGSTPALSSNIPMIRRGRIACAATGKSLSLAELNTERPRAAEKNGK